ncbi:L-seryl-tRNA(Sec) selenium transferase [Deltaproteobacteria bacterium OttesenSCG-928-K17]|nr:L-seryl-tRNA(Sec) selenium transferase [Deltaproteobacteria bacterium OttesenSCG-928-K17]
MVQNKLRAIPKVDALLDELSARAEFADAARIHLVEAIRRALENFRRDILEGRLNQAPAKDEIIAGVKKALQRERAFSLSTVVNATGVVLHTNLGRSLLNEEVAAHVAKVASSYSTLEYDPQSGSRGSRHAHVEEIITRLTGAEAALAVNNNAAAVLLILTALFSGREMIVSRGEMVEIGGSFRVPDIMEQSGAILREVGATNRTRLSDYARAIAPGVTGGLLKVHTSNYRVIGFTEQVSMADLAALAHENGLPAISDLGSGSFFNLQPLGIHDEPTIGQMLAEGADLVCFSGDKLLGAAQAGLIIGRRDYIDILKKHPLVRAIRVDKLTLAALEATLKLYLDPEQAKRSIPTLAMLFAQADELKIKAEKLLALLKPIAGYRFDLTPADSQAGGGSAPEKPLPSWAVAVEWLEHSPDQLEQRLRLFSTPIISRIFHNRLLMDVRTIKESEFAIIAEALAKA